MSNVATKSTGRTLLKTTLITATAAGIVTFLFVLPAEYGVDPTGVGARLGLLDLGRIGNARGKNAGQESPARLVQGAYPGIPEAFDRYAPDVLGEPFSKTHDTAFRSDRLTINLEPGEEVEYKAVMQQGDALVYAWKVDSGEVYADFHADPGKVAEGYPENYFIRYRESETGESAGSLVAPFSGNHGWYWLNIQENPVEITLEVNGYYETIGEVHRAIQ